MTEKEIIGKAITEAVCKAWQDLEARREEAGFETKATIFAAVMSVLDEGVDAWLQKSRGFRLPRRVG